MLMATYERAGALKTGSFANAEGPLSWRGASE
jgi:hypothetical protein